MLVDCSRLSFHFAQLGKKFETVDDLIKELEECACWIACRGVKNLPPTSPILGNPPFYFKKQPPPILGNPPFLKIPKPHNIHPATHTHMQTHTHTHTHFQGKIFKSLIELTLLNPDQKRYRNSTVT